MAGPIELILDFIEFVGSLRSIASELNGEMK